MHHSAMAATPMRSALFKVASTLRVTEGDDRTASVPQKHEGGSSMTQARRVVCGADTLPIYEAPTSAPCPSLLTSRERATVGVDALSCYAGAMPGKEKPTHSSSTNPYIPKGDGDAAVQAYISAMPGWKRALGAQIDATVEKAFPNVCKQVRWNTPFYGKDDGWFLAMYCYKKYVQITFMTGASLNPVPPKASKIEGIRYLDVYEDQALDTEQLTRWVLQSSKLPGQQL